MRQIFISLSFRLKTYSLMCSKVRVWKKKMNDNENQVQQKGISKKDLLPELRSVFENITKKEGYITYEITVTKISSGGANYTAELFEVDVKGETEDGGKETNLFLKKCVSDDVFGDIGAPMSSIYLTEKFVYQDLVKRFNDMQVQANVPEEERYKMVKSYENPESTSIILENLSKKGFRTPYRMDVVSLKYAELCMKELAKFHALSFALKIKHYNYFDKKLRLHKFFMKDDEKARVVWENIAQMTIKNLNPVYKPKVEKAMAAFQERFIEYHTDEYSPVKCLCYGDYRASNILMRENDGEVAEVIPVDYQAIHIGCPVNDILFFLTCGTDRKFRIQHLENLKTLYYDTLTNFLKYFNIDSSDVFQRKQMEEIFNQRMDYIPMFAVFAFPLLFIAENARDMNDSMAQANFDVDERFKERLIEILEDFPL